MNLVNHNYYKNKLFLKKLKKNKFSSLKKIIPISLKEFKKKYLKKNYSKSEQRQLRTFLDIGPVLLDYALRRRKILRKFFEFKYYAILPLRILPNRFFRRKTRILKRKKRKKSIESRASSYLSINYDYILFYCILNQNKKIVIKPFNFFSSLIFYKSKSFKKIFVLRKRKRIRFKFFYRLKRKKKFFTRKRIKFVKYKFKRKFLLKRLKLLKIRQFNNFLRFISFLQICNKINNQKDNHFKLNSNFNLTSFNPLYSQYNAINKSYKFFKKFKISIKKKNFLFNNFDFYDKKIIKKQLEFFIENKKFKNKEKLIDLSSFENLLFSKFSKLDKSINFNNIVDQNDFYKELIFKTKILLNKEKKSYNINYFISNEAYFCSLFNFLVQKLKINYNWTYNEMEPSLKKNDNKENNFSEIQIYETHFINGNNFHDYFNNFNLLNFVNKLSNNKEKTNQFLILIKSINFFSFQLFFFEKKLKKFKFRNKKLLPYFFLKKKKKKINFKVVSNYISILSKLFILINNLKKTLNELFLIFFILKSISNIDLSIINQYNNLSIIKKISNFLNKTTKFNQFKKTKLLLYTYYFLKKKITFLKLKRLFFLSKKRIKQSRRFKKYWRKKKFFKKKVRRRLKKKLLNDFLKTLKQKPLFFYKKNNINNNNIIKKNPYLTLYLFSKKFYYNLNNKKII